MTVLVPVGVGGLARQRLYLGTPALWPTRPFLPVVRRCRGTNELGVLFDAFGVCGVTGYSACVFLTNLFALPRTVGELLVSPREAHDTPDEVAAAGWRVD